MKGATCSHYGFTNANPMPRKKAPTDQSSNQGQWGRCSKIAPRQKEVILPATNVPQMKLKMEEIRTPQQLAHLATGGRGTGQGWLPVQLIIYHD